MRTFATIENNTVTGIIYVTADNWSNGIDITDLDKQPEIGWTYDEKTGFTEPKSTSHIITNLAFARRFSFQERIKIERASQHDPTADDEQRDKAAALRVIQERSRKALFVDLNDPETQSGVMYMEQEGLLTTERAIEILTAPILPDERPNDILMPGTRGIRMKRLSSTF